MKSTDPDQSPLPWEQKPNRAARRFWNVLTAILYLGSVIIVSAGSLTILPVFGITGLALYGWTFILCVIVLCAIWLFSTIVDWFGGL